MQFTRQMENQEKAKAILPNKAMYKHSHFRRFYFTDWRHTMHSKTQKKRNDLPFVAGESLSHDRQRGRAWFQPPSRPANPLRHSSSGRIGLRPTAGSAASHVRASFDRPLAEPRAQDREKEQGRDSVRSLSRPTTKDDLTTNSRPLLFNRTRNLEPPTL